MRCLRVNPWVYDFACYDLFSKPIGFLQIAGLLKKLGCNVDFIDCLDRYHPGIVKLLYGKSAVKSSAYGSGNYYTQPVLKPLPFKDIPRTYKRYGVPPAAF
jgi:hypothetical protein